MLTDFGRTGNLVGMANLQAQAQDQAGENTRASILLAVTQAYFDLLRADAVLKVAQKTVAARQLVSDQMTALGAEPIAVTTRRHLRQRESLGCEVPAPAGQNGVNSAEAELATHSDNPIRPPST